MSVNIMIASLLDFAVAHMELGFIMLGVSLTIWGSAHKRRRRPTR
jgi:hypothetical protein